MTIEGWLSLWDVNIAKFFLVGVGITVQLSVMTIVLGLAVAIVVGTIRAARTPVVGQLLAIYVDVTRSIPAFMLILYVFFVFPIIGIEISSWIRVLLALTIYHGSRLSEVVRAGILAISKGQVDASRTLGLSYLQTMLYIVVPQAFKRMLPSLVQESVMVIKNTSLALYVGIVELLYRGQVVYNRDYNPLETLIVVGIIFFILCFSLSLAARRMEGVKLEEAM